MDKEIYRNTIQKFIRDGNTGICCFVCGETNPDVLEKHHFEGRNNSEWLITLCKNCHAVITAEQNKLPPKTRSAKASPKHKKSYADITLGALCELYGKKLKELGFEEANFEQDCCKRVHKKGKLP